MKLKVLRTSGRTGTSRWPDASSSVVTQPLCGGGGILMLRLIRRRPAIATEPTIEDGRPAEPALQRQVLKNQSQTAAMWDETERDIASANIVHEREEVRSAHWQ